MTRHLPLIVEHEPETPGGVDGLLRLWSERHTQIEGTLHRHGAILFRNFGIAALEAFQSLAGRMGDELTDYVDGNSPRTDKGKGVYTSTEYPPEYFISLHNELSYSTSWPARLLFCCVHAADSGGETPLVDSRELLEALPDHIVRDFESKKLRSVRTLTGGEGFGPSWQKTFATTDAAEVERFARSTATDIEWLPDGGLRTSAERPATAVHAATGETVWFNQADQFHPSTHPEPVYKSMLTLYKGREHLLPQNVTYADGSPIPLEYFTIIRAVTRQLMQVFPWQRGDLLVVDNMLVAHGRMPFKGKRSVLVAMTRR